MGPFGGPSARHLGQGKGQGRGIRTEADAMHPVAPVVLPQCLNDGLYVRRRDPDASSMGVTQPQSDGQVQGNSPH